MSMKDGGPAFAAGAYEHNSGGYLAWQDGMSLRDYFAAKALPACIAAALNTSLSELQVSELAYNFADAMLKAREEKP